MKQIIPVLSCLFFIAVTSCNNAKTDAVKQAEAIQKPVNGNTPGTIATSASGYNMTAKIDGKDWSASHMMPVTGSGSYIYVMGEDGGNNMNFQLSKNGLAAGKKIEFSENHAANLNLEDVSAFFGGYSGYAEITKMDEQWMEGTFQFTASSSGTDRKVNVTDGRFRVALAEGLK